MRPRIVTSLCRWARPPPLPLSSLSTFIPAAPVRWVSSSTTPEGSPAPAPTGHRTVDAVNQAVTRYPLLAAVIYGYHNAILGGFLTATQIALGVTPPPALAVAFIVNRLTARLRTPLILLTAGALTKVQPVYAQAKLSALVAAPLTNLKNVLSGASDDDDKTGKGGAGAGSAAMATAGGAPLDPAKLPFLRRWSVRALDGAASAATLGGLVDRYGLSYLFAGRIVSTASLLGITGVLMAGVDTNPAIEWIAMQEDALAAWWHASTTSSGVEGSAPPPVSSHSFSKALASVLQGAPDAQASATDATTPSLDNTLSTPSPSAALSASASPTASASLLQTASDFTSRWAASCIAINACYTWVLRSVVAGSSLALGSRWDALMARVEAAEAAEAARRKA